MNHQLKRDYFLDLSSYLLCMMPLAIIAGPFIAEIFLSFISLYFIYSIKKKKEYSVFKKPIIKFFIFFYLIIVTRSLFSEDIFFSLKNSLFYFRFILFALAISFLLSSKPNLKSIFFNFLTFVLLLVCMDSILQILFGINISGFSPNNNIRISSFFNDELVLGSYLQKILPIYIALFFYFNFNEKKKYIFHFFIIALTFAIIFRSGERTAFYLILLYFVTLFILISDIRFKKRNIILITLLLLIIISIQNPSILKRNFVETYKQITGQYPSLIHSTKTDASDDYMTPTSINKFIFFSSMHNNHIKSAYRMFKDEIIFGHGVKMFRIICRKDIYYENRESCNTHPHNTYAQLLAETGLVGFLMFFALFIVILTKLFKIFINKYFFKKKSKISNYKLSLLIAFFVILWPLVPSGNFFNNWLNILYFFPLGFYLEKIKHTR